VLIIHPEGRLTTDDKTFTVELPVRQGWTENIVVYHTYSSNPSTWTRISDNIQNDGALARIQVYILIYS
jgi:hypothetical protein